MHPAATGPTRATSGDASGLLALLQEEDPHLRQHALTQLHAVVDVYWAEVANSVPFIEELSEDEAFPARELAAAVASKCFFHLEEYNDALRLALGAGSYFDITDRSEYVETLISKAIDEYVAQRTADSASAAETIADLGAAATVDPRLESIVERMFQRCVADGAWTQALGIALETRRLDKLEELVKACPEAHRQPLLAYVFAVCQTLVSSREFRHLVFEILVRLHEQLAGESHRRSPAARSLAVSPPCLETPRRAPRTCRTFAHALLDATARANDDARGLSRATERATDARDAELWCLRGLEFKLRTATRRERGTLAGVSRSSG